MNEALPLKGFTKCAACGTPMTGYINRKKKIYYYRCQKKGCNCNINANAMKRAFEEQLKSRSIDSKYIEPLKKQLALTFSYMNKKNELNRLSIQKRLAEIKGKIDKIESRFVTGDINKELYEKHTARFKEEEGQIRDELGKVDFRLSNLDKYINFSVNFSGNLCKIWLSGDYICKQKLQGIVYPEGMIYSKQEGKYLTTRTNYILAEMLRLSDGLKRNENGLILESINPSASVGPVGLEPTTNGL